MIRQGIPRALIVLLGTAAAVIALAGVQAAGSIVGPVVLALTLVIAVSPVRGWLARHHAPVWLQVAVPLAVVLLVLLSMVAVLSLAAAQIAILAPTYAVQFNTMVTDLQHWAAGLGYGSEQLNKVLSSLDFGKLIDLAQSVLSSLLGVLSSLFLIVVLLLAMSLDAPVFARIVDAASAERPELARALKSFTYRTRRYLIVSTVFGLICSVLDVIALYVLNVPLPLLWGVLALITNYIPNIGFVLGLIPPALLGLLEGGPKTMLLVIVAYIAINIVIQSFIQPKFLGDAVGLSTTVTFLSLIVWAWVLGPLGALLAIPLSLLVRALLVDSDPDATWAAALISGRLPDRSPTPAPEPQPKQPRQTEPH
ncbi:AI-2E family transporter [Microbispora rosea subsp. aerata]|nr:AI-2E family transporter [Microbispora rosea]GGO15806.1 AI-2E family transporter [Microbispora rosea subsp. aerata]GIH58692.1 AI-2E family transporter [Microbispora rosea subsp. aerata]GLJ86939.1 AI-2E family transporter [Microbispora rosea subsp. aerata]